MTSDAGGLLEELLSPLSLDEFLALHWECEPLHIKGKTAAIRRLIDVGEIEELIAYHGRSGQPPFSTASRGPVAPRHSREPLGEARRAHAAGETIFVPEIHLRWPRFAAFCRALELRFRHPVGATLVFGPAGAQGLTPHFDAAAVFALQVSGRKTWHVARPIRELPVFGDPLTDLSAMPEPNVSYELEPGDMLYVPMGFPHVAHSGCEPSLHVSVYVNSIRARDVVAKVLAQAVESDVAFRRPLVPGLLGSAGGDAALATILTDLLARLAERIDPAAAHAALMADLLGQMQPLPSGRYAWEKAPITADTQVQRAPGVLAFASRGATGAVLAYPGGHTRGPIHIFESFAFIAATERFRISELPGLDAAGQLVLVERLLVEGVLLPDQPYDAARAATPLHATLVPSV
jgi:ribosomal protein L16 Arg81 hydroxylase